MPVPLYGSLVARDPPERLLATVLPTLVLVAILLLLESVMSSTTWHWNDIRLAPDLSTTAAQAHCLGACFALNMKRFPIVARSAFDLPKTLLDSG